MTPFIIDKMYQQLCIFKVYVQPKISMKQILLTISSFIIYLHTLGQISDKELTHIKTIEHATQFIKSFPKVDARLFTITSDKDTSDITLPLFDKKVGYSFSIDDFTYKIVESSSYAEFRVSYIYLDGTHLTAETIDSIRKEILSKFRSGSYFFDLVKEYTMDGSPNGDLGWFKENMMVKEFENAVRQHKKNDIFFIDVPEKKWYYVTLKTFDDRVIRKLTILKVKKRT
jgi:parvulin-like peptidyl-prolyl isomerase